jgi:hypothetical protein
LRGNPAHLRLAPLTGATNPTAKLKAVQAATTRRLNRDGAFNNEQPRPDWPGLTRVREAKAKRPTPTE